MQETLSIKNMRLAIVAAAMAVIVAFSMGIGAQVAQAEEAVPLGKTGSITYKGVKFTFKNKSLKTEGLTLVKVKEQKKVSKIVLPKTVEFKGHVYTSIGIDKNAFKGTKAKTIQLQSYVANIKKGAFNGSKASKLIAKTKLAKKSGKNTTLAKKGWLKGSKIAKVYAKNKATKLVKKSYSGKAGVKAYKK